MRFEPCPGCGSTNIGIKRKKWSATMDLKWARCECLTCGWEGPKAKAGSPMENKGIDLLARDRWNNRNNG